MDINENVSSDSANDTHWGNNGASTGMSTKQYTNWLTHLSTANLKYFWAKSILLRDAEYI